MPVRRASSSAGSLTTPEEAEKPGRGHVSVATAAPGASADRALALQNRTTLVLRCLLFALLVGLAGGVSFAIFYILMRELENRFESEVASLAGSVIAAFHDSLEGLVDASQAAAAAAAALPGPWPNVTFAGFDSFAAPLAASAGAFGLVLAPAVTAANLPGFLAFVAASLPPAAVQAFPGGSLRVLELKQPAAEQRAVMLPSLYQYISPESHGGQIFMSVPLLPISRAFDSGLWACSDLLFTNGASASFTAGNLSSATGSITVPIVDASNRTVGVVFLGFSFDSFLAGALPTFVDGLTAVITSSASPGVYSWSLAGGAATPLGAFDAHDPAFDSLGVSGLSTAAGLPGGAAGNPVFSLSLYPTAALRSSYTSSTRPAIACGVCAACVVVVTILFVLHDALLSRRVRLTDAIVRNAFPDTVRGRVYQRAAAAVARSAPTRAADARLARRESTASAQLAAWLLRPSSGTSLDPSHERTAERTAERRAARMSVRAPICDRQEAASVLFADLVNFTSWAAACPPERVFLLLESVFRLWDAAALRHRVYKVETTGDCWMGAAGAPFPSSTHAVDLARLGLEMGPLLAEACASTGVEPGRLRVRVGLHSGPVISGVLRADRARFQMFGDTVNTASRMESTGEPGRVQVSSDTAALLAGARGLALLPRPGGVEAKGKGRLETFWVLPMHSVFPAPPPPDDGAEEECLSKPGAAAAVERPPSTTGSTSSGAPCAIAAAACVVDVEADSFAGRKSGWVGDE